MSNGGWNAKPNKHLTHEEWSVLQAERDALLVVARAAKRMIDDADYVVDGKASRQGDVWVMTDGLFEILGEAYRALPESLKAEIEKK